jgi:hypothetical protein
MSGIVAAGVARYHGKSSRKDVDYLAFAFIAPLGAQNHCSLRLHF